MPGTGSNPAAWGIHSCQFHTRNRELPGCMGDKQLSIPYQEQGATRQLGGINSCQFHARNRELPGSLGEKQLSIPYQEQGATRLQGGYTAVNSIPGTGSYAAAWGRNSCQFHARNREQPGCMGDTQLAIPYTRNRELPGCKGGYTAVKSIPGTGSYQVAWGINSWQFHIPGTGSNQAAWGDKQLSIR